jgi:hypothetical protein
VHLPTSEAVCERAISCFEWPFKKERLRSDVDLTTAVMPIRARQIRLKRVDDPSADDGE